MAVYHCDLAPPQDVITLARAVLGTIDLDPYSTPLINRLVLAARIYDRDVELMDDIVHRDWTPAGERRVFLGPPVGAGATRRLLHKTLREYQSGRVSEALAWIGHNETITRCPWLWDFPMCMPFRRLRPCYFDDELEEFRTVSPSDWSAIVYLPPTDSPALYQTKLSRFNCAFSAIGRVIVNEYSGEDDWHPGYRAVMKQPYNYRE